ncbi:MAG: hypothetical protein HY518_03950 [Candidatus Aenigmarchaeota archaeon]|nr:hypothetical protein [Candidatus Aenigmarchaeota archaeon]
MIKVDIKTSSEGIFEEAIRTLPVTVYHGRIIFLANGLVAPTHGNDEEPYRSLCESKGIMPFTQRELTYDGVGFFVDQDQIRGRRHTDGLFTIYSTDSRERKRATFDGFLKGGKISRLRVLLDHYSPEAFEALRGTFLDQFISSGYEVAEGHDIGLATYDSGKIAGLPRISLGCAGLSFGPEGQQRHLSLEISPYDGVGDLDFMKKGYDKNVPILKDWFEGLKTKYQP